MPSRANKAADLTALTATNPVFDLDNVYLSDRGWAYRHYKNDAKTEFWDELLVAGNVASSDTPDAFGAANPTFETGDSNQAPTDLGATAPTIANARIVSFADAVVSTTTDLSVVYDAAVTDATFAWSTDEALASFDDNTAETPVLTHSSSVGSFTLTCVISSVTATDSPVTVTFDYDVVAA